MQGDPAAARMAHQERREAAISSMGISAEQFKGIAAFDRGMVEKLVTYALERESEAIEARRVMEIERQSIGAFKEALMEQAHKSLIQVNDTLRGMFDGMVYTEHMRGRIAAKKEHEEADAAAQLSLDMNRIKGNAKPLPTRR